MFCDRMGRRVLSTKSGLIRQAAAAAVILLLTAGVVGENALAQDEDIPPELPVEVFAQLPQIDDPQFSPDGKYLAMIRPLNGLKHLAIQLSSGGGKPVVIPPFEEFQVGRFAWANNQRILVSYRFEGYRYTTPVSETRLFGFDVDGANGKYLVKQSRDSRSGNRAGGSGNNAQIQDDIIHYLPDEPDHILLSIDSDQDGASEVRKVNVNTGNFVNEMGNRRGIQRWQTDRQARLRFGR